MFGSGRIRTRQYDLSGFTSISASRFEIEIIQSSAYGVTIRADDNLFGRLDVRTAGGKLILRARPPLWGFWRVTLEATVQLPTLTGIKLRGAASAQVPDFREIDRLDVALEGASELRGRIAAKSVRIETSGASRVTLAGSTGHLFAGASGASRLDLAELAASTGAIEMSGASRATVNVASEIEYLGARGASQVRYLGDPAIGGIDSTGASRVTRAEKARR